jgi:hypothetical protein
VSFAQQLQKCDKTQSARGLRDHIDDNAADRRAADMPVDPACRFC